MSRLRPTVTWCAEAGAHVGIGHVMRGVPLAEACRLRGVVCNLVVQGPAGPPVDLSAFTTTRWNEGFDLTIARGDIVVFDGYSFGPDHFAAAAADGAIVAVLEDHGEGSFPVDALIDIDSPTEREQRVRADTVRLNGPSYSLIREEFVQRRRARTLPSTRATVAITFGGSDPTGTSEQVVRTLRDLDVDIVVVKGPYATQLTLPDGTTVVEPGEGFAAVVDAADLVVAAAGNTAVELAAMGHVSVLMPVAANQEALAALMEERGAAHVARTPAEVRQAVLELLSPDAHLAQSRAAQDLVDGLGASRLLDELLSLAATRQR